MGDKRQKVVIEMDVLLPGDMDNAEIMTQETGIKTLLTNLLQKWGTYPLSLSDVTNIKVAIVPAAAGEEEGETRRILLSAEQSDRAEDILQQDFVPPIQAYSLQVRTAPPTLTGVVYTSGQPHLVSHTLTEEEVLIILGPEEEF